MPTVMEIETTCARVARRLRYARGDEVVLLRTARALLAVHRSAQRAAHDFVPPIDRTSEGGNIASMLAEAECGLRRVVLACPAPPPEDMGEILEQAAVAMSMALDLLKHHPASVARGAAGSASDAPGHLGGAI